MNVNEKTEYSSPHGYACGDGRQLGGVCEECKFKWYTNMWEKSDTGRKILTGNGKRLKSLIRNHNKERMSCSLSVYVYTELILESVVCVCNQITLRMNPTQNKNQPTTKRRKSASKSIERSKKNRLC